MEDRKIIELYWQRDESAIKETATKYEKYLSAIARNILEDEEDGKEVVNDTYFKAWETIPPGRPEVLATFLGKLTRQLAIDKLRKRISKKRGGGYYYLCLDELQDLVADSHLVEHYLETQELAALINQWLSTQPVRTRDLFLGRYFCMDSIKKLCGYYGMTESGVKSVLYRARSSLKRYLEKKGYN